MAAQNVPRAEVIVDLDAIRHNVALLAGRAERSGAATMAVVKADGYGHGAVPVARAALAAGATWLGACSLAEAVALREAGIAAPILSWLDTVDEDLAPGVAAGIDLSASSVRELGAIVAGSARAGRPASVHLKIDTGLSRNGCPADQWPALVDAAAAAERDGLCGIAAVWSHLACADEPGHPSIDVQAKRFEDAYQVAKEGGLEPSRHLANSAATLNRSDLHFDLVRVGIAMYGLNPLPPAGGGPAALPPAGGWGRGQERGGPAALPPAGGWGRGQERGGPAALPAAGGWGRGHSEDLRPAMTFRSSVALTKRIAAGESVSYGQMWTAGRDTNLALVPVGYADGIPRALSGRMQVLLAGRRRPVVGRVCMDQIVVDCGDDRVAAGDEVILFGAGDCGEPTAREWADTLGTIDYEIVTGMYRPRISRTYRGAAS